MKYRLVIFDSDGTLADTLPWCRSVFNQLAEQHGFRQLSASDHERLRDVSGAALLKELHLPLWKLPRVVSAMRRLMTEQGRDLSLFPGVPDMLRRLAKSGIQLGVVSSNSRENVQTILGREHAALINHYSCGASMFGKAPKLRAVLRVSGVSREHALYIGDECRDAHAAAKAGIAFGAVSWGQQSRAALQAERPAEFFESVTKIAERLC